MTKNDLKNATLIILTADGRWNIFKYDESLKQQPQVQQDADMNSVEAPSIFLLDEDKLFIRSKNGLVPVEEWDNKYFKGALKGWANEALKRPNLNPVDITILHDILAGKLP